MIPITPPRSASERIMGSVKFLGLAQSARQFEWLATNGRVAVRQTSSNARSDRCETSTITPSSSANPSSRSPSAVSGVLVPSAVPLNGLSCHAKMRSRTPTSAYRRRLSAFASSGSAPSRPRIAEIPPLASLASSSARVRTICIAPFVSPTIPSRAASISSARSASRPGYRSDRTKHAKTWTEIPAACIPGRETCVVPPPVMKSAPSSSTFITVSQ